jgi:hypothetical protein
MRPRQKSMLFNLNFFLRPIELSSDKKNLLMENLDYSGK